MWRPVGPSSFDSQVELARIDSLSAFGVKYQKSRGKLPSMLLAKSPGYAAVAPFCRSDQMSPGLAPSGDSVLRSWSAYRAPKSIDLKAPRSRACVKPRLSQSSESVAVTC